MKRPDDELFKRHAKHFESIDPTLKAFCEENDFELQVNLNRQPCRVLRKRGNPELIFDFYQNGYWLELNPSIELPHTLSIAAFFYPSDDADDRIRLTHDLVADEKFRIIREKLKDLLNEGLTELNSWKVETFYAVGTPIRALLHPQ